MQYILTGGHSGIGLELSKILLEEGHQLGLILRSKKREADALAELGNSSKISFFYADLSNQDDVAKVAKDIATKWDKIDGLFNNAGVLADKAYYSPQGNELQFEVNALAPYLLTKALQPLLDKADNPVVVNTGTGGMHAQKGIDIEDLKRPKKFVKLIGAYMKSKFAMVVLMNYLASKMSNIRVVTVDPGPNKTKMTKGSGMPSLLLPFRNLIFGKATKGAKKLYDGAFSAQFKGQSGIYITGNKVKPIQYRISKKEIEQMFS